LVAAKAHGFQFPDDIDDQVIMDLEDATVKEWFYAYVKSQEVRRLGVGGLMGVIRDRMVSRAQHTEKDDDLKLAVYSGHDT
jgi:acid phosphatase